VVYVRNTLSPSGIGPLAGSIGVPPFLLGFLIAAGTLGPGFVLHELSHKFVAQRYGYWAEFRMWPYGLLLVFLGALIGFFFAAPGATYISGSSITEKENGVISLAGPMTNVALALLFLPFLIFGALSSSLYGAISLAVGGLGLQINLVLAAFNMIPIFPLDGSKVFRWSKVLWVSAFLPLVAIVLYIFLYGIPI
jgi:Zn-dependent protease